MFDFHVKFGARGRAASVGTAVSDLTGISNQAAARWADVAGRTWNATPNSELGSPNATEGSDVVQLRSIRR